MIKLLGVVGSLRTNSNTSRIVQAIQAAAREQGAETRLLEMRQVRLPLFDPDAAEPDPAYEQTRELVEWADAFILASPDYHGCMSGAMKNFLDYFWHELIGKLFGYVVASHEKGLTVQDQLRTAVRQCYGWSLPYGIGFNGDLDLDGEGNIVNERLAERIRMCARDLVVYGELLRGQFRADKQDKSGPSGFAQYLG